MRVIILLALLGAAYAVPKNPSRIVGGTVTTIQTYPYMSNMQYTIWTGANGPWYQACGGSLITSTAVLSAAHCFYGDALWQWRVVLGSSMAQTGAGGLAYTLNSIVLHAQYNQLTMVNDVAIARLNTPAAFSNSVQTASIPSANYNIPDGTTVTHIGWGTTSYGGQPSDQLRHVHVNVINQQLCAQRYAQLKTQPGYQNWPDITDGMICSGILNQGGKDACQGDSGGPLALPGNIVIGVTSWGYECAHSQYPGVSARVSQYTNWIVANVR